MARMTRRQASGRSGRKPACAFRAAPGPTLGRRTSPSTRSSTAATASSARVSRGLAEAVQEAARRWGLPNAYILGQEASGAFVGGLRYGEGKMYTRNAGDQPVFWQGPSLGFDWGADGDRTMMLVYNLPAVGAIYQRFGGVDGSAYFVGGFGFTALDAAGVIVVPIRTGVGARLGVNVGYLKFTPSPTWNPF